MRRIGLFGGSFDPVHNAHLALAHSALDTLGLDALYWIPAGRAWQKDRLLSNAEDRTAMLGLAIAGEARYCLELCEVSRPGPSYTIDTVLELKARDPSAQWILLLGQDQLVRLSTWHRWRELLQLLTLAVANRAGDAPKLSTEFAASNTRLHVVPLSPTSVSSTDIRARVAMGKSIASLVPAQVASYIEAHGLYRNQDES